MTTKTSEVGADRVARKTNPSRRKWLKPKGSSGTHTAWASTALGHLGRDTRRPEPGEPWGAAFPKLQISVIASLLLKSTTSTFSQLRPVDAGHSRKKKRPSFSHSSKADATCSRDDKGDTTRRVSVGGRPRGLTAPWPGPRSPGSRCPFCSGPSSAPAAPGWASALPRPGLLRM